MRGPDCGGPVSRWLVRLTLVITRPTTAGEKAGLRKAGQHTAIEEDRHQDTEQRLRALQGCSVSSHWTDWTLHSYIPLRLLTIAKLRTKEK